MAKKLKKKAEEVLMGSPGKLEEKIRSRGLLKLKMKDLRLIYKRKLEQELRQSGRMKLERIYRMDIAGNDYESMQDYVKDWNEVREHYFEEMPDEMKYELFAHYGVDKL